VLARVAADTLAELRSRGEEIEGLMVPTALAHALRAGPVGSMEERRLEWQRKLDATRRGGVVELDAPANVAEEQEDTEATATHG
jgi:hypothetical protein